VSSIIAQKHDTKIREDHEENNWRGSSAFRAADRGPDGRGEYAPERGGCQDERWDRTIHDNVAERGADGAAQPHCGDRVSHTT
jgi:hypothetical protein